MKKVFFPLSWGHLGDFFIALPAMQAVVEAGMTPCTDAGIREFPDVDRVPFGYDCTVMCSNAANMYDAWMDGVLRIPGVNRPVGQWPIHTTAARCCTAPYSAVLLWCRWQDKCPAVDEAVEMVSAMRNPVLLSMPGGEAYCAEIAARTGALDKSNEDDADVWMSYLANAEYALCADTGAAHAARALGKRTAVFFKATPAERYAPPGAFASYSSSAIANEVAQWS